MSEQELQELRDLLAEYASAQAGLLGGLARLELLAPDERPTAEELEPVLCFLRDAAVMMRRLAVVPMPRLLHPAAQEEQAMTLGLERLLRAVKKH